MSELTNNCVLITGASEGIGRALARTLAPERPRLVLAARNHVRLGTLKKECEALGAETVITPGDLTKESTCKAAVDVAIKSFGRLDALVNNAGQSMCSLFKDVRDISIFEHLMRLNYLSAVYCTYHALPHLISSRGRLVAVSSITGLTGIPTRSAYCASKHALFGFFDSLRIELTNSGVSVTLIAPDIVISQLHKRALDGNGKPFGESRMVKEKAMTAQACAQLMVDAITKRKRLLLTSTRARIGRWLKLLSPGMVDNIARKAIAREGGQASQTDGG